MQKLWMGLIIFVLLGGVSSVFADNDEKIKELEKKIEQLQQQLDATKSQDVEELKRQVAILAEEVEKLRSGEEAPEFGDADRRALGLGPSAATVYSKKQGVSLAGYGEMLYENFSETTDAGLDSEKTDQIDFLRGVFYFGYRFNDRFLFNSEVEFEHANTEDGGEAGVEFAHVDYRFSDAFTLRGGMVLMPLGFVNEFHEPNVYLGSRRPLTETVIIPTTWRENGFGFAGHSGMFVYRAYLTNGMKSSGFSAEGLEEGKQEGALAKISTPSFSGRIEASPRPGLLLGGSIFTGNSGFFPSSGEGSGEKSTDVEDDDFSVGTFIGEIHGEYRTRGFEVRALYAGASLDNVQRLNDALYLAGDESVGETLHGGYLQFGYNVLAKRSEEAALTPYFRYEAVNTQASVPSGFSKDPANDQTVLTFGVQYQPIHNIVLKSDYQIINNEADTGIDQWNISLGYSF